MTRLPDLPGKARGVVGWDEHGYTLQCERCHATEQPKILILMTFKFHNRHRGDNPRLCRPCRVNVYAECGCHSCKDDRKAA